MDSVVSRLRRPADCFESLCKSLVARIRTFCIAILASLFLISGILLSAQSLPLSSPSSPLDRAQALSQKGDQSDAERILDDYVNKNPGSERAHALLGLLKYRQGFPTKSLDQYSLAVKYGSLNADDLRIVALDYIQLRDLPSAERWLKASISLNRNDWRTWRYLAGVQYSEEHPVEAASSFQRCLDLDPGNALAEDGLARSHEVLGYVNQAAEEYHRAVLFNSHNTPPSWLPLLHYGSYLRRTSRLSEAIPVLKQAGQLAPDDWEVHAELAQALEDNGKLKDAEAEYQRAIVLAPDRARLHFMLARTYQHDGQKEKAAAEMRLYKEFAAKNSENRDLLDR